MDVDVNMGAIFMGLPEEKQRAIAEKFVDQQVNSEEFGTIILMPDKDENGEFDLSKPPMANAVDFKAVVDECGKEYAINMMMDLLGSGAVSCKVLSSDSINALMDRCATGKASPEDYAMASSIIGNLNNGFTRTDATTTVTHILLDFIDFCNIKQNVKPYLSDIMTAVIMLIIGSMVNQEGTPMARFRNSGPNATMNMVSKMSQDIDKALDESIFKNGKMNNQFMVLALLHLAGIYAAKDEDNDKMLFADAKTLADMFGIQDDYGVDGKNSKKSEDGD